jgi:hypothetical protein
LIDEHLFDKLQKYKWYFIRGYAYNNKRQAIHRMILGLKTNRQNRICTDHINHDTLDNRLANLRVCSDAENGRNKRKYKKNTASKYKGITKDKNTGLWIVEIRKDRIHITGGVYFVDEILAALRYDQLAREHHGEFAFLNFPEITDYSNVNDYIKSKKPISEYRGVFWDDGWRAVITLNKKTEYLGFFETELDAALAYDEQARKNSLIDRLNFPNITSYSYKKIDKSNTSKYKRVWKEKRYQKWVSAAKSNITGKVKEIGRYSSELEAYNKQQEFISNNPEYTVAY